MRVLLINHRNKSIKSKQKCFPPISLMYLASSLIKHNYEVKILDANAFSISNDSIIKEISRYNPDFIGIGLCSEMLKDVYKLVKLIKFDFPNIKVLLGGPHVSAVPHQVLKEFEDVDFLLRGDSEHTIIQLCEALSKNHNFKNVRGLSYRKNKEIVHNPPAQIIKDLDELDFPERVLLKEAYKKKKYFSMIVKERPIDIMISSRGCPFSCNFCYNTEKIYRARSVKNVLDEILEISSLGIKNIEILDNLFTFNLKRAMAIFDAIKKENLDITFRIKSRVDFVNRELLAKAKSANVYLISYGTESGSQYILNNMNKKINLKMIEKAYKITKQAKIKSFTSWIIGFPGETPKTINETIKFILKIKPFALQVQPLLPYPATQVYNEAKTNGTLVGDWSVKCDSLPWIKLPWIKNYEDLLKQAQLVKNKVYLRPYYIYMFFNELIKNFNLDLMKYGISELRKSLNTGDLIENE